MGSRRVSIYVNDIIYNTYIYYTSYTFVYTYSCLPRAYCTMNFICILFELHRARCMEYEPFGKYNHVLPVDHTNSPLFWIQAFLVVERACITLGLLLQSELALFEGFSFILKTRRGISCAWLSAKCPDRNTLKHWMLKLLLFYYL